MRVLVADDSAIFRRVISQALASLPEVEVVGSAATGVAAVKKTKELKPDLLTLDIEMPGINGLEVLDALRADGVETNVILVSALTQRGGALTLEGLAKGAFDFITKPVGDGYEQNLSSIRAELAPRVRALAQRVAVRKILRNGGARESKQPEKVFARPMTVQPSADAGPVVAPVLLRKPELVLIGVSTGGPNALERVLCRMPGDLGVPVLIVQHMPPLFTRMLAENLDRNSQLTVREAVNQEVLMPNCVYIAPGGRHMRLVAGINREKRVEITDDPPENNCKPAVDYLFRSAARNFPGETMAVILTGMGSDGTLGLRLLKRHGCKVLAQDESTCVVFGMPKAAIDAGVVDTVLPIDEIGPQIAVAVRGVLG